MEKVKLIIAGETYNLTTEDDVDQLVSAGMELDEKINGILQSNGRISVTQAAVITALDYGDRLKRSESDCENLRTQIQEYLEEAARARTNLEISKREVEKLKNEIASLKSRK